MDRVMILGLIVALSCASASQVFAQLGPFGPAAPSTDLPGAQQPWNPAAAPLPQFPTQAMPAPNSGFGGPYPFDPTGGSPLGGPGPGAGSFGQDYPSQAPPGGVPATYVSPNPMPKAPQNLGLYRPSMPEGIEAKKLSPLPSVSVREYPYLRRGQTTDRFITPPGMEMPEAVGQTSNPMTWRDRLRNLFDPLGVLP
jgi:hypothetical protein